MRDPSLPQYSTGNERHPPPNSPGNEGLGLGAESLRENMDELGDTATSPSSSSPCPKKGGAGSV